METRRTPSTSSRPPTISAPAFFASSACLPSANTNIRSLAWALVSRGKSKRPLGIVEPFPISVLTTSSYVAFGEATSTAFTQSVKSCCANEHERDVPARLRWHSTMSSSRCRRCSSGLSLPSSSPLLQAASWTASEASSLDERGWQVCSGTPCEVSASACNSEPRRVSRYKGQHTSSCIVPLHGRQRAASCRIDRDIWVTVRASSSTQSRAGVTTNSSENIQKRQFGTADPEWCSLAKHPPHSAHST